MNKLHNSHCLCDDCACSDINSQTNLQIFCTPQHPRFSNTGWISGFSVVLIHSKLTLSPFFEKTLGWLEVSYPQPPWSLNSPEVRARVGGTCHLGGLQAWRCLLPMTDEPLAGLLGQHMCYVSQQEMCHPVELHVKNKETTVIYTQPG